MERETSPVPPKDPRQTATEEKASSPVPEITLEVLQTLDQPEEGDVWLMEEEGDDSVFYSDEEQTNQDVESHTSCDVGVMRRRCPMNSEAREEPIPQREPGPGAEAVIGKKHIEMEKNVCLQFSVTERELQRQRTDPLCLSESPQPNCTNADKSTQPEPNSSSETANVQINEEKAALESWTANLDPSDVSNEVSCTALNRDERVKQTPGADPQSSGNGQPERDQEDEQGRSLRDHDRSPGRSTLPRPKTAGPRSREHDSFDHLASSKYSTVSYRRIRRGNTRQRVEEFENMLIKM